MFASQADIARRIASFRIIDDVERRHPYPGQKFKHGWIPVEVNTANLDERAARVREMEQHVAKLRREGPPPYQREPERYVKNEEQARIHRLPIGARIPKRPELLGYESLPSGHWRDPATGRLHGEYSTMGWGDDILAAEEYLAQLKDPSWYKTSGEDAVAVMGERRRRARDMRMRRSDDQTDDELVRALGHDITPGNDQLHHYWTRGPGLARWAESKKPWTTLLANLTEEVHDKPPEVLKRWASKWFHEVFGFWPGSDLNRVTHGAPPRGKRVGPG